MITNTSGLDLVLIPLLIQWREWDWDLEIDKMQAKSRIKASKFHSCYSVDERVNSYDEQNDEVKTIQNLLPSLVRIPIQWVLPRLPSLNTAMILPV